MLSGRIQTANIDQTLRVWLISEVASRHRTSRVGGTADLVDLLAGLRAMRRGYLRRTSNGAASFELHGVLRDPNTSLQATLLRARTRAIENTPDARSA
jgi:hypothetical protein